MVITLGDLTMTTTRRPNGLTTAKKTEPLGDFILPDMTKAHVYWEDFDYYNAANWTVTEVGVATQVLTDEDGGVLLITNAAADNDSSFNQKIGESFLFEIGKKLWFEARFKVSDATQSDWRIGIYITDTTPLNLTDGVYFRKDDGDSNIGFFVEKDDVSTFNNNIATQSNNTFQRMSFFYNGVDSVAASIDGVVVATLATTNLPDDENLTISFGIQNGEAVAKTMSVDYILAAKER